MKLNNIYSELPDFPQNDEIFQVIAQNSIIKIERIISSGQQSPDNFWYEQENDEFVILLSGSAVLQVESSSIIMKPGDYLVIPARQKHRVESTDKEKFTIWLAVHHKS